MNDQNTAQWQPPGANLNQAIAAANNGQQQFAQQGPPQFAPVPNGQPQFLGTPPPQPVQWRMDQLGTPQTQPMQLQQAPQQQFQQAQQQQQALPPGVMRAMDGTLWHTVNGQNVPWQQGTPVGGQLPMPQMPQQQPQPQPTPDEIRFAAMLVTQRQNLPANASPGQVAMYSAFIQQPMLAQQYLQATTAHANMQAQSAPPSQGVVPTDAPPANTQSTTPEAGTGGKKAPKLPAFKPELVTDIAQSLSRIANALETIVVFAREGNNPPPVETAIQQQPPPVVTQFQQAQPQFQQQQPVQNSAQFQPNGAPNFQPGSGS